MECINKIITEVLKFLCRYLNLCAIPWLWGISHVTIGHEDHVLEIGCGNGKRIKNLIQKAPSGQVFGLDKSEEKIEEAKKLNKKEIEEENCAFVAGDPEHLPFETQLFPLGNCIQLIVQMGKSGRSIQRHIESTETRISIFTRRQNVELSDL